ncbi:MAG: hypothetical protein RML12_10820 [Xanthomonadales bacterium]|nr:hypothetical protein [Xanthomonadales bacterium]
MHRRRLAALLPGRRFRALLAACLAPGAARPPVAIEPHPALAGRGLEALS